MYFNVSNVQEGAETEDDKYTISVSVICPRKVGDGVGAYMVYKVVTKVCRLPKFLSFSVLVGYVNFSDYSVNCF